jgi:hypothetical protein
MSFKTYDHSQNYTAQIIKLPPKRDVQGLDNLKSVDVFGNDCLVGKDSNEKDLYVFFRSGTRLSAEFLSGNNLYRDQVLNKDPTKAGFFDINGLVKSIRFRGVLSTGFVIPVHALQNLWTDGTDRDWACGVIAQLKVGDSFNELDGVEVCRKYVVPPKTQSQPGAKKERPKVHNDIVHLVIPEQFRFHNETPHLANNTHRLQESDIILISDKWHGSSCILSKVLIRRKLNIFQRILNLLGGQIPSTRFGYIYSSGKPKNSIIKGIDGIYKNNGNSFYSSDIWKRALDDNKHAIEDGISLYGELVGFQDTGGFIQKGYDYQCEANKYRFVVYRITYTKPDGTVIEFSWQQIKDYCEKYGLETVKQIYFGKLDSWPCHGQTVESFMAELQRSVDTMGSDGKCTWCVNPVPPEGVCVRVDGKQSYSTFKIKSKLFLKKESDELEKGEENIEDNG